MKNDAISLQLSPDRFDRANKSESLGELLEKAAAITFPHAAEDGYERKEMRWIARHAIRAVCREIIRNGNVTIPMEVTFTRLWQKPTSGFSFQPGRN